MNKPNIQKSAPYVVLGAENKADKAVVGFKSEQVSGYEVHICQLRENHDFGEDLTLKDGDITGEYFTMYFCKRDSLRTMIKALQEIYDKWIYFDSNNEDNSL